jgi:hypothetical protein
VEERTVAVGAHDRPDDLADHPVGLPIVDAGLVDGRGEPCDAGGEHRAEHELATAHRQDPDGERDDPARRRRPARASSAGAMAIEQARSRPERAHGGQTGCSTGGLSPVGSGLRSDSLMLSVRSRA